MRYTALVVVEVEGNTDEDKLADYLNEAVEIYIDNEGVGAMKHGDVVDISILWDTLEEIKDEQD